MQYDEEKIEAYLLGHLEEPDLKAFNDELELNSALKQQVDLHRIALSGIEEAGVQTDKLMMDEWETELQTGVETEDNTPIFNISTLYKIAAVIIILLIPTYFFINQGPNYNNVYENFYQPFPNYMEPTVRSNTPSSQSLNQGLNAYEQQKYARAYDDMLRYYNENESDRDIPLYLGLCQQALGNHEQALIHFDDAIVGKSRFNHAIKWYTILSHLKLGNIEEVILQCNELSKEDSSYALKAKSLLDHLE